jgi:hypothetical protein
VTRWRSDCGTRTITDPERSPPCFGRRGSSKCKSAW